MMAGTVHHLRSSTEPLLSKSQLAEHLGVSRRTVENRMAQGMPHIAPSPRFGQCRFRLSEVEAWLAAQAAAPKPAAVPVREEVAELRREVRELRAIVNDMRRSA